MFASKLSANAFRIVMNYWPLYFGTGGKITYISRDWKKVKLQLSVNWLTRNYVGTIFGGSMFSASDPFFMIMYIRNLGPEFVVWDKGATILFKRPGKTKITADLHLTDEEIADARAQALHLGEYEFKKKLYWRDPEGRTISEVERILYVATKNFYDKKRAERLPSQKFSGIKPE